MENSTAYHLLLRVCPECKINVTRSGQSRDREPDVSGTQGRCRNIPVSTSSSFNYDRKLKRPIRFGHSLQGHIREANSNNVRAEIATSMASHSFLPLSSPPALPALQSRRPSLDHEREILSTRGQRILSFLPGRTASAAYQEHQESPPPTFLRRGSVLIGHSNPRYEWCVTWSSSNLRALTKKVRQRYYRPPETLKGLRKPVCVCPFV